MRKCNSPAFAQRERSLPHETRQHPFRPFPCDHQGNLGLLGQQIRKERTVAANPHQPGETRRMRQQCCGLGCRTMRCGGGLPTGHTRLRLRHIGCMR